MKLPFVTRGAPIVVRGALASVFVSKVRELLLFRLGFGWVYVLLCACKVLVGLVLVGGFVGLWSVVGVIVKCC